MKILFASAMISSFVVSAIGQQNPFAPPATSPPQVLPPPTAGQATTPANQGVLTNPTGPALGNIPGTAVPTNATGAMLFDQEATNQTGQVGGAPLFLSVVPIQVTDATGQPLGTLQQLSLTTSGTINFGIVNMGGRLVPVPWQLIMATTTGRGDLALNVDSNVLQTAPPVFVGNLPALTQDQVQEQIFAHFASQMPAAPMIIDTENPRGRTGPGITITGGDSITGTTSASFTTNFNAAATNMGRIPNRTVTNQAGGLLSPTGQTNAVLDPYKGPGSGNPNTPPNPAGQPSSQQPR